MTTKTLTCSHCGHQGEDVIERLGYVGGRGFVSIIECRDRTVCWARWDRQHQKQSEFYDEVANAVNEE